MKLLQQLSLALGAHDTKAGIAVLKENEGRNAHDLEAASQLEVLIDVDLADLQLARILRGDLVKHRSAPLARTPPFRPEIHENRLSRSLDLFIERLFGQCNRRVTHRCTTS